MVPNLVKAREARRGLRGAALPSVHPLRVGVSPCSSPRSR